MSSDDSQTDSTIRGSRLPCISYPTLIDKAFVKDVILKEAPWRAGHGASNDFLGTGIMYYANTYMLKARVAVCLGSGGGFVPRLMRQAQRDIGLAAESRTILIDANLPEAGWGRPMWMSKDSFFRRQYGDVEIMIERTATAASKLAEAGVRIDYLHIDADHSYRGCLADFVSYMPLMSSNYVITLHDTDLPQIDAILARLRLDGQVDLVNYVEIGRGLAVLRPRLPRNTPKLYRPFRSILRRVKNGTV
jgi:hypothetical protein